MSSSNFYIKINLHSINLVNECINVPDLCLCFYNIIKFTSVIIISDCQSTQYHHLLFWSSLFHNLFMMISSSPKEISKLIKVKHDIIIGYLFHNFFKKNILYFSYESKRRKTNVCMRILSFLIYYFYLLIIYLRYLEIDERQYLSQLHVVSVTWHKLCHKLHVIIICMLQHFIMLCNN